MNEKSMKKTKRMGILLGGLFWLQILQVIVGGTELEVFAEELPELYYFGSIISLICWVAYSVILIELGNVEPRYRNAGICVLIGNLLSKLVSFIGAGDVILVWTIVSIFAIVLSLIGIYNECIAHSKAVADIDGELSSVWESIWKWSFGICIALLGGILAMQLVSIIGLLIIFGAAIGLLIVGIVKIVYLYKTGKVCREYKEVLIEEY